MKKKGPKSSEDFKDSLVFQRELAEMLKKELKAITKERDKYLAALEGIDNMSACYPFAPDPRDLCRAMGERAQTALKMMNETN